MTKCRYNKSFFLKGVRSLSILFVLVLWHPQVLAQIRQNTPISSPIQDIVFDRFQRSLQESLTEETLSQQELEEELRQIQRLGTELELKMDFYQLQIAMYNSLLFKSTTRIKELEVMRSAPRLIVEYLETQSEELSKKQQSFAQLRLQTERDFFLNQTQLQNLEHELQDLSKESFEVESFLEQFHIVETNLSHRRELLQHLQREYIGIIEKLHAFQQETLTLLENLDRQIEQRRQRQLFERTARPLQTITVEAIQKEWERLIGQAQSLVTMEFWWMKSAGHQDFLLTTNLILFGGLLLTLVLLVRIRRIVSKLLNTMSWTHQPWSALLGYLLHRSFLLVGVALYIYLFAQIQDLYSSLSFFQMTISVLMIWISTQWFLDILVYRIQQQQDTFSDSWRVHLHALILVFRYVGIISVLLRWSLGKTSVLVFLGRLLLEIGTIAWLLVFRKRLSMLPDILFPGQIFSGKILNMLIIRGGIMIVGGGILLDLVGYGQLASFWYSSWGMTGIVLFWGILLFYVLREWGNQLKERRNRLEEQGDALSLGHQVQWLLRPPVCLAWLAFCVIGLDLSWEPRRLTFSVITRVLTYTIALGDIRIRLLDILVALLMLLSTWIVTNIWRYVFQERFLRHNPLGKGVQRSLTTLSVYLFWTIGILWALNILGVSMTSATVIFGALGIGIGFGLQDIVNNFISGLILLFERPVEVNDVIEVNGIRGSVKKISARATVVQTFENSTLIIPNSEMLSHRVTNWTFRDPHVRRTIRIGVAYGSDVALVKQTLSDIANAHSQVLTNPEPMILFQDFAESALLFELRIWTLFDYGLTTETDIRSDIDRIFREKNIIIPFPQHDVHLIPATNNLQDDRGCTV